MIFSNQHLIWIEKAALRSLFISIWLAIFVSIFIHGWTATWSFLGIESMYPPFADLRTVQGGLLSLAQGLDPQLINPGDPWGRPMNYPAVWLDIGRFLHFQSEDAYMLVIGFVIALYCAICFYLLTQYPSVWLFLLSFSGASLLAIERGNNDLIIFIILFLAASFPLLIRGPLILLATILKIYPVFAVLSMAVHKRFSVAIAATLSTILFAAYILLFDAAELQKLRMATPVGALQSYGSLPLALSLDKFSSALTPAFVSAVLIALSCAVWYFLRAKQMLSVSTGTTYREEVLFLVGAPIFLATFVLMGNWDYRLIFLIFCIPYVQKIANSIVKNITLILILTASNQALLYLTFNRVGITICKFSKALLFIAIAVILLDMVVRTLRNIAIRKVI